jgi:hypothetical protein
VFFFEKKNQKTLANGDWHFARLGKTHAGRNEKKFLGSFFQKRTPSFLHLMTLERS